ncbi:Chemotaxis protein CheA [Poriferisphaera corsica]|uniref:histidine kinase n=1 Tax=Poriferisphaera corsica TaxID=2528020 RepID=A0A517YZ76_9BACT|nr:chemotaxis protein CheA [Poriferisphaera corsica]QDU35527.1 Chemotaxis protein CheA [Poriferisphaera corsica]
MSLDDMDQSLLQDFLTEAGELIEQLDSDLVQLENVSPDESSDLCNSCFRALHTIKGAASFLGLTAVTTFAHAAEDCLNCLRKGEIQITPDVMDALLRSADIVRDQIESLSNGEDPSDGPQDLIDLLHKLASGTTSDSNEEEQTAATQPINNDLPGETLDLPAQKVDLIEFMVIDLQDYSKQLDEVFEKIGNDGTRHDAAEILTEIADNLIKTADFFELDALCKVVKLLDRIASTIDECPHNLLDEVIIRLNAAKFLIDDQTEMLGKNRALHWPLDTFVERTEQLCNHQPLDPDITGKHNNDIQQLLILDQVIEENASANATPEQQTIAKPENGAAASSSNDSTVKTDTQAATKKTVEQTIRVEVSRLESLLNLVGQLVLNKNRVLALTRNLRDSDTSHDLNEEFVGAAGELDRLMGELQVSVMRTRMQPLAKLFDRYPRVIRDIARMTDKKINLQIEGKETEVDKSVLEQLADPLVHILRNSADHGVESPEARLAVSKAEIGTITLSAEHQGSHVRVAIKDDGKGLDREVIGNKAIERGLTTQEQLAQLTDSDVFRFIFEAGFSTAEQVSDLSGRGVGMDVVRTNINKLNGSINIQSKKGRGTTIEILIPLTVAIMPAMVVGVGNHTYSVPLQSILEIVRPTEEAVYSINGQQVMRLRDSVLPLINMRHRLNETETDNGDRFAVVVAVGGQTAGLVVDRLIGQQEIVIKPLDDTYTEGGPFSGATIQEDGEVCLILDVIELLKHSANLGQEKAAA